MKTVNEVLSKVKGENKVNETVTGKGSFSKSGFEDLVSSLVNDTGYKIPTYDKMTGEKNGELNVSELIRSDLVKTVEKAKWPQKSEVNVLDTCDIVTKGLSEAIPHIITEHLKTGKKLDLPQQSNFNGSIYLLDVKGRERDVNVRDPKTQENLGTCTITTKDHVQIKSKSPVPKFLQEKVRKDANGNVIK